MPVSHAFTSSKADDADATLVRPTNWNAGHVVSIDLATEATGILPEANGGTGSATPPYVKIDGTSTTTAEIPFAVGVLLPTTQKIRFTDANAFINASSSGNLVVQGATSTTIGVAGDIVLGDSTLRVMYPQTDQKIDGGDASHRYNAYHVMTSNIYTSETFSEAANIILGTTTGTKIGTATSQKIGFFNATPIIQVGATTDLGTVLSNLGLRAAGTAYPLSTSGAVVLLASAGGSTDGQVWNDTTQKAHAVYESGIKQMLSGCIFTQTADKTVSNTVTETSIIGTGVGTITLPAAFFVAGKSIRLRIGGVYNTPALATPSVVIKAKYGSTVIATVTTSSLLSGATNLEFDGEVFITCRSTGASGTVMVHGDIEYATGVAGTISVDPLNNAGATTTIDTTTSNALDITVTWDSATSTRSVKSIICSVEVLN